MDDWVTIRNLKERGCSIKRIARELAVGRNTVKRALRRESPPEYRRGPRGNPKIEPLRDNIAAMLAQGLIGTRIFREIHKLGYEGSRSALYSYLTKVKGDEKAREKVCERVETPPGEQGQFDWSVSAATERADISKARTIRPDAKRHRTKLIEVDSLSTTSTYWRRRPSISRIYA